VHRFRKPGLCPYLHQPGGVTPERVCPNLGQEKTAARQGPNAKAAKGEPLASLSARLLCSAESTLFFGSSSSGGKCTHSETLCQPRRQKQFIKSSPRTIAALQPGSTLRNEYCSTKDEGYITTPQQECQLTGKVFWEGKKEDSGNPREGMHKPLEDRLG
jgi:hypothetical protein